MEKQFSAHDLMSREHLLKNYYHLGDEFRAFVLESYDLKTDSDMFNYSATSVQIVKDFYSNWSPFVHNIIQKYGKGSGEALSCLSLIIETCIFGIENYSNLINNIQSNKELSEFIQRTNSTLHFKICKELCYSLNQLPLDSSSRDRTEALANTIIYASSKVELYLASQSIPSFKRTYKVTYPNMKNEGCYIATMVYHSYDAPQVVELRKFRDNKLKPYLIGRLFIHIYYTLSPYIVKHLTPYPNLHRQIRKCLSFAFNLKQ